MSKAQFLTYFQALLKYITSSGIIFKGHKLCVSFLQYSVSALFILQNRSTSYRCPVIHVILKEILYCLLLLWLPRRVIEFHQKLWLAFEPLQGFIPGFLECFMEGKFLYRFTAAFYLFLDKKENSSFYLKVIQIIHYKL